MQMVPDLSEEDLQLLLDAYKVLVQQASEEVRQVCDPLLFTNLFQYCLS